jgi:hypothetical protein
MPLYPLNITCEILINGTWIDISDFVYQRDDIVISGGKQSSIHEQQTPASMLITLNNRDGRFTPNYVSGQYYPFLQRNVQIRLSVNGATSSSGNTYTGFRFWGDVKTWPLASDPSESDVYAKVVASGPLRRLRAGGGEGSALQRYYAALKGSYAPIAYWPCEEDPNTGLIGAGVQAGANMSIISGAPKFKAVSDFNGSAPIGVLNRSIWTGITSSFGTSGDDIYSVPGIYTFIASTTSVNAKVISGAGGATKGQAGTAAGGSSGGGSAWAGNAALAMTPGQPYTLIVGQGGGPGNWQTGASDGMPSSIVGDVATVLADPGHGAQANAVAGTRGLASASTGTVTHDGGDGLGNASHANGGPGGGSSGGPSAAGAPGNPPSGSFGGAGGVAPAGGGNGGNGGGNVTQDGQDGFSPGGGAGAGWANVTNFGQGGQGASGSVELVYTSSGGGTQPNNNVMRFILKVPRKGGNGGKVLARMLTTSTGVKTVDVQYRGGGNLRMLGYNSVGAQVFDSGNITAGADGQTLMVSAELAQSGTSIAYSISAIQPGAHGVVDRATGTVASATMGSVSQVVVAPNGDITKTAMGHFSIQYALIPLWKVSRALDGHHIETGINRFRRLANEQVMGHIEEYSEGNDHFSFEAGVQGWTVTNGALTTPTTTFTDVGGDTWPTHGTHSLLLTANGAGQPRTISPTGTGGGNIVAGDTLSTSIDYYSNVSITNAYIGIAWYNGAGTFLSEVDTPDFTIGANEIHTFTLHGSDSLAPPGSAFYALVAGAHSTLANGTKIYIDHAHTNPHMGPQTHKHLLDLHKEISELEQGIMREAKTLWGLAYRTRMRLINQTASVTLNHSAGYIAPDLVPSFDHLQLWNNIIVHRHKGNKVEVALLNGAMSILEPPQGHGRSKKTHKAIASADEQLAALASHLLLIGTSSDGTAKDTERYSPIRINMALAGFTGNGLAPLMSAIAGVEIGDMVQLSNLPFWFPASTAKQLVIGYTETINTFNWIIEWNCVPYAPYVQVITNIRKW